VKTSNYARELINLLVFVDNRIVIEMKEHPQREGQNLRQYIINSGLLSNGYRDGSFPGGEAAGT
jgi:hypothetical protein